MEIRASNLAYPMQCAGSVFFNLPPQEEKEPARMGTAAGEWLRHLLERQLEKPSSPFASNGFAFDDDMHFYTEPIAKEILSNAVMLQCETELRWKTNSGITITGHQDVSFVRDGKLYIDDLKYGWGIVDVFENWQLLAYAIMEVMNRKAEFSSIVMRIHQPRPHHEDGDTRSWEISIQQLWSYKEQIEVRMHQIAAGFKGLQTGPKCKYCPAAGEACPAFNRAFYNAIDVSCGFIQDRINESELSHQLDLAMRSKELIDIKLRSLEDLAVSRIKAGKVIPNYISETKYGHRKWKDGLSPTTIKTLTGIDVVEKTMMTPAKAEKAGVPKEFVKAMASQFLVGQNVVRKNNGAVGDKLFGKEKPQ